MWPACTSIRLHLDNAVDRTKGRIWRRPLPDSRRLIRSHIHRTEKVEERKLNGWRNDGSFLLFIQVSRNVN